LDLVAERNNIKIFRFFPANTRNLYQRNSSGKHTEKCPLIYGFFLTVYKAREASLPSGPRNIPYAAPGAGVAKRRHTDSLRTRHLCLVRNGKDTHEWHTHVALWGKSK